MDAIDQLEHFDHSQKKIIKGYLSSEKWRISG